ncbi:lytic transglycosylase domain-containing protein [Stigmatella aurantiaca]|uniref:Transglycosylase SLT domain protein n=1 Tax=Stigmatella aurantiaca (strain DW4/3-1) TaxID=378806 RepID=E3FKQ5_STIAD|nr:lytic transglycosylase domain-containing protein [Stigmatella aurantiaca]ADO69223.1 Transglycosylase SLT domain protein [Stigmatella aurantiaca DW4/3-1]
MARKRIQAGVRVPGWAWLVLCVLAPLVLLNGAIAFLGETQVPLLSLSFLPEKAHALGAYTQHRAACFLEGHPPLEPLVADAERRHRLPPGLLQALVQVESEARVHRISPAGAMGPGQLMPGTARMLKVEDPFEPVTALDGSARYLARQLARFDDVRLAVAAYNAGPGAVEDRVPRNGETEFYVAKVLTAYARLRPPPAPAARPAVAARPSHSAPPPALGRPGPRPPSSPQAPHRRPTPPAVARAPTKTEPAPLADPARPKPR